MKDDGKRTLTPKLRFPEFRDDGTWDTQALDDVCDRIDEKVGDVQLTPVSITAGRGFVSQAEKFGRNIAGAQYKNYILLRQGDFAYNKGYSKRYPQGCVYRLKEFSQAAASNAFICFRLKDGNAPGFIEGLFEKNAHGRQLLKFLTSGARSDGLLNIRADEFFSVRLAIPPRLSEQQKIADCLTSLDEVIAAQGRKVAALKAHKKGLMQQLFPRGGETLPPLRFPEFRDAPEWADERLSASIQLVSGVHLSPEQYSTVGDIPYFTGPSNFTNDLQAVARWTAQPTNAAKKHDTLITVKGSGVGELWYLTLSSVAMGRQLMAVRVQRGSNRFVYHFLQTKRTRFEDLASGNLIPGLSRGDILDLVAPFPSLPEQQRIADCLSSLDDLIAAQNLKLNDLKTHKKGLMQQLFPSQEKAEA